VGHARCVRDGPALCLTSSAMKSSMKNGSALTPNELATLRAAFPCQFYRENYRDGNDPYSFPACLWLDSTAIRPHVVASALEEHVHDDDGVLLIIRAAQLLREWPELLLEPRETSSTTLSARRPDHEPLGELGGQATSSLRALPAPLLPPRACTASRRAAHPRTARRDTPRAAPRRRCPPARTATSSPLPAQSS